MTTSNKKEYAELSTESYRATTPKNLRDQQNPYTKFSQTSSRSASSTTVTISPEDMRDVKTNNIPHISYPGGFEEDEQARKNLPTAVEEMEVLKGHEQCDRRQKMNISDCVAPSIVDGDDDFLDIIENGGICL